MPMFTAYFDASGHGADMSHGSTLFVAGLVASVEKWVRFEERWLTHLKLHNIAPPFHMTDFISGVGQYEPWKYEHERRAAFLCEAVKIIKVHTRNTFSAGVVVADLARLAREYELGDLPSQPYAFAGAQAMFRVAEWAQRVVRSGRLRATDRIEYVFELGDLHQGHFLKFVKDHFGQVPALRDKGACVPFQACDLVGWALRRGVRNLQVSEPIMPAALADILRLLPGEASGSFHSWAEMELIAKELGLPRISKVRAR